MNTFKKLLTAGVLIAATAGLSACSTGYLSPSLPVNGDDHVGNEYNPQIKTNFMNSCVTDESMEAYCGCVWDAITDEFTQDEFVVIDRWFADGSGEVSQRDQDFIQNTFATCVALHINN